MAFRYAFDERKATQAAGILIARSGGSLNYMKLIKLLYLADRAALARWGRPIVPDRFFSLGKGPILSRVLELINEEPDPDAKSTWQDFISAPERYSVRLLADPGADEFSRAEMELLDATWAEFGSMNEFDLVAWCHRNLPEWKDPGKSRAEILPADILTAAGWTKQRIREHLGEEQQYQAELRILQKA